MAEVSTQREERAFLASAVLIATGIAAGELAIPNDLFWHLAIAREIVRHGFPYADPFSFSAPGIAWSPPEWLGELAYGGAYAALGWAGTTLLTLAAVAIVFTAVARAARSVAPAPAAALAVLVFAGPASVHLPMRPLVLGDALLAIVVERMFALRRGDARGLALLPLLFALWANVHPSWPTGLAILWMHAAALLWLGPIAARLGLSVEPLAETARRPLVISALASPLAVLARPDGIDGALYPFVHVVGLGDRMREIIEWFPPDLTRPANLSLLVLLALTAVLLVAGRGSERARLLDVALVLLGAAMALRYQRFLPLAAFLCAPVLARLLGRTRLAHVATTRVGLRALVVLSALFCVAQVPSPRALEDDAEASFPVEALGWVARHPGSAARPFDTFEDGGYLLFARPGHPVFIDSRFDLYARSGVFDDYLALRRGERIAEIVERYRFDAAFVPTTERDENFAALEAALPSLGFALVHADAATHLWTRSVTPERR